MHKTTFTLAEAAQLLHCHKETVRKAILDGSLQAARLGRSYRISRADLQKFWTECGGGELFDKNRAEGGDGPEGKSVEEDSRARVKRKKPDGPHQLSLPLE